MFSLVSTRPNSIVTVTIAASILISLKEDWRGCGGVAGINLAPVFWNLTNPIFKASKNDHIIVVNLFDEIDFVCPYYPSTSTDASELEYYLIYRVSKKEYDDCNIYSEYSKLHILRCKDPRQKRRFTILFEPFQSIPNVPEYKAGHTYYFITPSTGRQDGLDNLYKGACLQHNMKLTIKVRDGDYEVDQHGTDLGLLQETFKDEDDQREQLSSTESSDHRSVPSHHGTRTLKPSSSKTNHRKESQRLRHLSLTAESDSENQQHPLGHVTRPTHSVPLHHNTRTSKTHHSAKNSHSKDTQRHRQSNSGDSASVVDVPSNQEAFLKSGHDHPSPSSAQNSWSSSALRLTPFHRSPMEKIFLLTAHVTVAFVIDRWSRV